MNVPAKISEETRVNMTSKGQVLLPKAIRDKIGLIPGGPVRVGINDRGEAVVLPDRGETREELLVRIDADIAAVTGIIKNGMTTEEMMLELRGDEPFI